jgi:hypothetical protein
MGFRKSLKRLGRKVKRMRPGKDKYKKTAGSVKKAYENPTDMGARGEAAVRLSAAPVAGSQYVG